MLKFKIVPTRIPSGKIADLPPVIIVSPTLTSEAFLIGDYSFFDTQPIQFYSHSKNHKALGSLKNEEKVKRLIKISEGWYTITKENDEINFNDLRFGLMSVDPQTDKYAFSYQLKVGDNELQVIEQPKGRSDAKKLFSDLWERIKGN